MIKELLTELGLRLPDLVAGFAGGVASSFVMKQSDPRAIVASVVVGTLTAGYLGEPATRMFGTAGYAASFIVGLGAMAICQGLIAAVRRYRFLSHPPARGGDNDA